jgi:hypothetical protein
MENNDFFNNVLKFQPGNTVVVYLQSQTITFQNVIFAGIVLLSDGPVLQIERAGSKILFKEWCGIECGDRVPSNNFNVKGV